MTSQKANFFYTETIKLYCIVLSYCIMQCLSEGEQSVFTKREGRVCLSKVVRVYLPEGKCDLFSRGQQQSINQTVDRVCLSECSSCRHVYEKAGRMHLPECTQDMFIKGQLERTYQRPAYQRVGRMPDGRQGLFIRGQMVFTTVQTMCLSEVTQRVFTRGQEG